MQKSTNKKSTKTESPTTNEKSFRAKLPFLGLVSAVFIFGGGYLYAQWQLHSLGNCPSFFSLLQGQLSHQNQKECIDLENRIMTSTIQFMGGTFVAFTAYVAWLNLKATEDKNVTERYTRAIEQLGSDKIEVRLGGIYALERIARDSNRDHWTIIEVLTSFVQEQSNKKMEGQEALPFAKSQEQSSSRIPKDVQAALTVIGRREINHLELGCIDLSSANLKGVNLIEANFTKANFMRRIQKLN